MQDSILKNHNDNVVKGMTHIISHNQYLISGICFLQLSILFFTFLLILIPIFRKDPDYFAVSDHYLYTGDIVAQSPFIVHHSKALHSNMIYFTEPMHNVESVRDLARIVASKSLTLDFANYYKQLESIRDQFTEHGWKTFSNSLLSSGFIDSVLDKKLSISSVVTGVAVLQNSGLLNGSYAWRFQMPILVTFESANEIKTQNHVITIVFKRIPLVGHGADVGVAVDSFVTSV